MKQIFLPILLGLAFCAPCRAQTTALQNADAVKNYDGIGGHFAYALSAHEHVNVNYALTPKHPSSVAHFMVHTPDPMPFRATISDASGKTVYTWKPEQKVYLYNADWNVSSLASGTYTVKIYVDTETKSIYEFNFIK